MINRDEDGEGYWEQHSDDLDLIGGTSATIMSDALLEGCRYIFQVQFTFFKVLLL